MNFARYFKTSSYSLIGAGFVAISATERIPLAPIVLFTIVLITSWHIDTRRIRERIPSWILNCIALIYLPLFLIDARLLSQSVILSAIHFLFFLASVKLLTLSRDRDYLQLYLISFAELLAASVLTVNLVFGICLLVFIASGISTLVLYEMRRSNAMMQKTAIIQPVVRNREPQESGLELFSPFPARLFFVSTIGMTFLVLVTAIPLFLLLPRITQGFYRQPRGDSQFISGFSDQVELGRIGTIKQSDAVVMRVKTTQSPPYMPEDLKWRGLAFDHFDGRSWRRSDHSRYSVPTQGHYYKLENSAQGADWLNQTFFIEALSTNVVFAARKALAVSLDVGLLQKDATENLYTSRQAHRKLRYSVISDPLRPDPKKISDLSPTPQEILDLYLQLPLMDSRISNLAKKISEPGKDRYSKAQAIERYLRSNYGYSLVLRGSPNRRDPLAAFLFDIKKGHCEYFASSMAVMLRQIGIPARLVNGFRIGEYNDIGNNWIVRQYHAHSWVEAYFPPYGWIEFDPTPADPKHPRSEFARWIGNLTDAIDIWWWEGVVNYGSSSQYQTLRALYAGFDKCWRGAESFFSSAYEKGHGIASKFDLHGIVTALIRGRMLLIGFLILGVFLVIRSSRKRLFGRIKRAIYRSNPKKVAASFYGEALALLGNRGLERGQGQTAMEFALSLEDQASSTPLLALTHMYYSIRFGPPEMPFNPAEARAQLRLLRNALRKR